MSMQDIRHRLGDVRRAWWPHYKEWRLHRLGDQDAWWLEREHEVYLKYERRYAGIVADGVPERPRERRDRVWVFWQQGMENAPDLVRACHASVLRALPDKEVTVIDSQNLHDYVELPGYIEDGFARGQIPRAHYSDLVRASLVSDHGGTWMDSTLLLSGGGLPCYAMSKPLFCFKQINLSNKDLAPIVASSWYISAFSGSPILRLTRELLHEYWRTHDRLEQYFMFHIFFAMACRRYPEEWAAVPTFNNATPHELMFELGDQYSSERWEQICRATDVHKLTRHLDYGPGTNYQHILDEWLGGGRHE